MEYTDTLFKFVYRGWYLKKIVSVATLTITTYENNSYSG